jgi:hypothetical protein
MVPDACVNSVIQGFPFSAAFIHRNIRTLQSEDYEFFPHGAGLVHPTQPPAFAGEADT